MSNTAIRVKGLCFDAKNTGRRIINSVDFSLADKEFVVMLGANGSGKSTLFKLLNSELQPTAGVICLGADIMREDIVCLSQSASEHLCPSMTIAEHIRLYLVGHAGYLESVQERLDYLSDFSLALLRGYHQPVDSLSGGETQILMLALVLLKQPKILLLDEHTSALDPKMSQHVMDVTAAVIMQRELSVMLITHDLALAKSYGDRVVVMRDGQLHDEHQLKSHVNMKTHQAINACYI